MPCSPAVQPSSAAVYNRDQNETISLSLHKDKYNRVRSCGIGGYVHVHTQQQQHYRRKNTAVLYDNTTQPNLGIPTGHRRQAIRRAGVVELRRHGRAEHDTPRGFQTRIRSRHPSPAASSTPGLTGSFKPGSTSRSANSGGGGGSTGRRQRPLGFLAANGTGNLGRSQRRSWG